NVKIKGFNGTNPTDSVNVALCAAGGFMTKWCTCSIASLGKVTSLKFTMEGSDTGEYGLNTPAYFALDNVVIVK
ncbi:MAG TPA: hypothetical protein DDW22_06960, partial [Prevotellaceae bacterium]|nr:hypothetical protein [Prevotellaceae bacterium]